MVKRLIRKEKLDLIGLTETKIQEFKAWDLKRCWGNTTADWEQVTARQNSGGALITWNQQIFSKTQLLYNAKMAVYCGRIK